MNETMWMVRAGEGGHAIDDFTRGFIALGWSDIPDLKTVKTQDEVRGLYDQSYPDEKLAKAANAAAMIYKFRHTLQLNGKVTTYNPQKREYLVGQIVSDYFYDTKEIQGYPHIRKVKWIGSVKRDLLKPASRNSLGSNLALFSVNEEVTEDLLLTLSGKTKDSEENLHQELGQIKDDTIARAHELIKDKLLSLTAHEMEQLVAAVIRAMGYKTRVTPGGPDRGIDITASKDGLCLEEPRIKVQVKHRPGSQMGAQDVRSFLGGLRDGDKALYVSTGGFSKEARYESVRSTIPLTLIDLDELANLVVINYDNFDSEGRVLIPLVRIYWPAE